MFTSTTKVHCHEGHCPREWYITIWLSLLLAWPNTAYAAPLDDAKQFGQLGDNEIGVKSKFRRSDDFLSRSETVGSQGLKSPELDELELQVNRRNLSSILGPRAKRDSEEMKKFLEEMVAKRINCSIEFPVGEDANGRKRREANCKEDGDKVVCSAGGFRFVLDGGPELSRARRFIEEVYGTLENLNQDSYLPREKEEETSLKGDLNVAPRDDTVELSQQEDVLPAQSVDMKFSRKLETRDSPSSTSSGGLSGDEGIPTCGSGSVGGGSTCGGAGTECPTFRVYPPYFSTPCCRTTQSCPTKPCPIKPRPVMFITAPPVRALPTPTLCCLGEPTCASQSTTCPTLPSTTCHEHTCPLTGQAKCKIKTVTTKIKVTKGNQDVLPEEIQNIDESLQNSVNDISRKEFEKEESIPMEEAAVAPKDDVEEAAQGKEAINERNPSNDLSYEEPNYEDWPQDEDSKA